MAMTIGYHAHDYREGVKMATVENRGTKEVPFGYVYVGETRVGFHQQTRDVPEPTWQVWPTRPEAYWPVPTEREFQKAKAALVAAGIVPTEGEIVVQR